MELPQLPFPLDHYLRQAEKCKSQDDIHALTEPFIKYESKLREIYAQQTDHQAVAKEHTVSIFAPDNPSVTTRARELEDQPDTVKDRYLLTLTDDQRRAHGSPAIVKDLKAFKANFNLFSESSLSELDWNNVVACGSSVVTALLPIPEPHNESKRALRSYYHTILAPASDVDLFIYGLNEDQAIEKIKQIERSVRDSVLSEITTIRTKNTITIVSEYPTRHVQIVLRLYKSVSEILTGFDVDCSAVAYDGQHVWASPRALSAFMTQMNTIDLTRRSPSYENRLSKYSHRGFEVQWPALDRRRIDPTIFERSFGRVHGLARLLVLEKLPHPSDRDTYLVKRREERGRPPLPYNTRHRHQLPGNVKDAQPDDVAEWVEEDDVSNYHTFTIPYGPKYTAKRIEKLLFSKDLLLNAEWNRSKDRKTNLHRHPAFFGRVQDVLDDCCGHCPEPESDEDLATAEEESKIYISGKIRFLKDDPGRQTIGSFHPLTDDDWTEMAYIGNTQRLCQAIVENDAEGVKDWFESGELEQVDVNRRDHAGRTPLHLATMCSTSEIVQILIDRGARIVSRIFNGMTALHIAAYRGDLEIVKALLDRSASNEEQEDIKEDARKEARRAAAKSWKLGEGNATIATENADSDDNVDELDEEDSREGIDDVTEGSFIKVDKDAGNVAEDNDEEPDFYDVDVLAWDNPLSPLHFAIIGGRVEVIKLLVEDYGADVLLPVKILSSYDRSPQSVILTLVLALGLPLTEARATIDALFSVGASPSQADMGQISALQYAINAANAEILDAMSRLTDAGTLKKNINALSTQQSRYGWYNKTVDAPLLTAIRTRNLDIINSVLDMGANPEIRFEDYSVVYQREERHASGDPAEVKKVYLENVDQPVVLAAHLELPEVVSRLLDMGASVNSCPRMAYQYRGRYTWHQEDKSLLDLVDDRIMSLKDSIEEKTDEESQYAVQLGPDDQYLDQPHGFYQSWYAAHDLAHAKSLRDYVETEHNKAIKTITPKLVEGEEEKKQAVKVTIEKFAVLSQRLRTAGAKSFHGITAVYAIDHLTESTVISPPLQTPVDQSIQRRPPTNSYLDLFPDAPKSGSNVNHIYNDYHRLDTSRNQPYKTQLDFFYAPVTDRNRAAYIQLFEAAWRGDQDAIKEMCLRKESPLQVAVKDSAGFSPFSLAVARGHRELALAILEIAAAQYQPDANEPQYRYRIRGAEDEGSSYTGEDSEADTDEQLVVAQLVDDKFTIDDITVLADNVKSRISPLTMMGWEAELWRVQEGRPESKVRPWRPWAYTSSRYYQGTWAHFHEALAFARQACQVSLVQHAITINDLPLLRFLLRTGMDLKARGADEDDSKIYQLANSDFEHAIKTGRMEAIGEIISKTGAGVPLQKMVQATGLVLDEKPRFYQGLSVYGKKRKDWAAERNAPRTEKAVESEYSPLLRSLAIGNIKSAEYFMSDAPLHRYKEFAEHFKDDKRVQGLAQSEGGIDKALTTWLSTRLDLALHMSVLSDSMKDGSTPLLDYILRAMPETLEVRSRARGSTALQLALELGKISAAKALIEAGANQAVRNNTGENLMHTILTNGRIANTTFLPKVLSLLEPKLIEPLLLERCSSPAPGSLTPLALYLQSHGDIDTVKLILDQSHGKELDLLNGAGDYILHNVVRHLDEALVLFLVDYRPELLYYENATGMTPIDVAETQYLRSVIESPPRLNNVNTYCIKDQDASKFAPKEKTETQQKIDKMLDLSEGADADSMEFRMDRLLKKLAEKYPGKRRLVSVIEANEVAKRLAVEQQKKNAETRRHESLGLNAQRAYYRGSDYEHGSDGDKENAVDEVQLWKGQSDARKDLAFWEIKIRKERGEDVDREAEEKIWSQYGVFGGTKGE